MEKEVHESPAPAPPGHTYLDITRNLDADPESRPRVRNTRAPRFVTPLAQRRGADPVENDLPIGGSLCGLVFESAVVVCTHADLGDENFRRWLECSLEPRAARLSLEVV